MRLNRTDVFATLCVGAAVLAYALWLADAAPTGLESTRALGGVVLGLGWLASAVAVVPNAEELIHSSRVYLVVTSLLGVAALVAGIVVLVDASEAVLALLVATTVVMWVLATVRHTLSARRAESAGREPRPVAATVDRELIGSGR